MNNYTQKIIGSHNTQNITIIENKNTEEKKKIIDIINKINNYSAIETDDYIERDIDKEKLMHLFQNKVYKYTKIAICGAPGIGKTTTIQNFRKYMETSDSIILTFNVGEQQTFINNIAKFSSLLSPEENSDFFSTLITNFDKYLDLKKYIFIFDDVLEYQSLDFLPQINHNKLSIVITSRFKNIATNFTKGRSNCLIELQPFEFHECLSLLKNLANSVYEIIINNKRYYDDEKLTRLFNYCFNIPIFLKFVVLSLENNISKNNFIGELNKFILSDSGQKFNALQDISLNTNEYYSKFLDSIHKHLPSKINYFLETICIFKPDPLTITKEEIVSLIKNIGLDENTLDIAHKLGLIKYTYDLNKKETPNVILHRVYRDYFFFKIADDKSKNKNFSSMINFYRKEENLSLITLDQFFNIIHEKIQLSFNSSIYDIQSIISILNLLHKREIITYLQQNDVQLLAELLEYTEICINLINSNYYINKGISSKLFGNAKSSDIYFDDSQKILNDVNLNSKLKINTSALNNRLINNQINNLITYDKFNKAIDKSLSFINKMCSSTYNNSRMHANIGFSLFRLGHISLAGKFHLEAFRIAYDSSDQDRTKLLNYEIGNYMKILYHSSDKRMLREFVNCYSSLGLSLLDTDGIVYLNSQLVLNKKDQSIWKNTLNVLEENKYDYRRKLSYMKVLLFSLFSCNKIELFERTLQEFIDLSNNIVDINKFDNLLIRLEILTLFTDSEIEEIEQIIEALLKKSSGALVLFEKQINNLIDDIPDSRKKNINNWLKINHKAIPDPMKEVIEYANRFNSEDNLKKIET